MVFSSRTVLLAAAVIFGFCTLPAFGAPPAPQPLAPHTPPDVWMNPAGGNVTFSWSVPAPYSQDGFELEVFGNAPYHRVENNWRASSVSVSLASGRYQWRVRYHAPIWGYSNWSSVPAFALDNTPPALGYPDDGVSGWSNDNTPTFTWSPATDAHSGVNHYRWHADSIFYIPTSTDGWATTTSTSVTLPPQPNGLRSFMLQAVDALGNKSTVRGHYFQIDVQPPEPVLPDDMVYGWTSVVSLTFRTQWPHDPRITASSCRHNRSCIHRPAKIYLTCRTRGCIMPAVRSSDMSATAFEQGVMLWGVRFCLQWR